MTCRSAVALMETYLDGELDAPQMAEIATHLAECPDCAAAHRRLRELSANLRAMPRYAASAQLEKRVLSSLRAEARPASAARFRPRNAWAIAATALLAVCLGWNAWLLRPHADIAQEIVSSHIRSLIGDHLLDVSSTDRHNVKPWFNGKLDYSPDVKDLAASGFPLIGGRVDYIDRRPVAVMVYKRAKHVINLFAWPSDAVQRVPESVSGFNLAAWNQAGMNYCAISDLNPAELRQFAELYR